jgi:hypothetical protein
MIQVVVEITVVDRRGHENCSFVSKNVLNGGGQENLKKPRTRAGHRCGGGVPDTASKTISGS